MAKLKLTDIADIMKHIDICMMTTQGVRGALESRPMSNNRDVAYTGSSYFFTDGKADLVRILKRNPQVNLAFAGHHSLLNRKPVYISVAGRAKLSTDKAQLRKHWTKDLDIWFKKGVDTPGLTLIQVRAASIKYWDGWEQGEVKLSATTRKRRK